MPEDFAYLAAHDPHISAPILQRKIAAGEVFVAKDNGVIVGWLRYSLFWDSIPLMNMLFVDANCRSRGIGTQLVIHWEAQMSAQGFTQVMTSTLSNETSQHFYRKLGYQDIGALLLPNEPLEIILLKQLPNVGR